MLAWWVQIGFVAYALAQLLVLKGGDHLAALMQLTPWRRDRPVTAGLVRLALQRILGQVNLRTWGNPKSRKFRPPAVAEGDGFRTAVGTSRLTAGVYSNIEQDGAS